MLEREEVRALLVSIGEEDILDLRDRAMIGTMLFLFARVGALVRMQVRDYRYPGTTRAAFVLHEKGGKHHPVPAHHHAAELVDARVSGGGGALAEEGCAALAERARAPAAAVRGRGDLGAARSTS